MHEKLVSITSCNIVSKTWPTSKGKYCCTHTHMHTHLSEYTQMHRRGTNAQGQHSSYPVYYGILSDNQDGVDGDCQRFGSEPEESVSSVGHSLRATCLSQGTQWSDQGMLAVSETVEKLCRIIACPRRLPRTTHCADARSATATTTWTASRRATEQRYWMQCRRLKQSRCHTHAKVMKGCMWAIGYGTSY